MNFLFQEGAKPAFTPSVIRHPPSHSMGFREATIEDGLARLVSVETFLFDPRKFADHIHKIAFRGDNDLRVLL